MVEYSKNEIKENKKDCPYRKLELDEFVQRIKNFINSQRTELVSKMKFATESFPIAKILKTEKINKTHGGTRIKERVIESYCEQTANILYDNSL